jgi:DNA-3-methyladenine glycosylase
VHASGRAAQDIVDPANLRPLTREFFNRDPRRVARQLLGKLLVRGRGPRMRAGRIVELEAYLGTNDPAAHAFSGPTDRNRVLFGPPGRAYVYFIYGNHYCLNVSCEPEGKSGCVLFRALEPVLGIKQMMRARGLDDPAGPNRLKLLTSGPGRLAEAFDITRSRDNDRDLTDPAGGLWIADDGYRPRRIAITRRIGITKAAEQPLRFVIADNPFVSRLPALRANSSKFHIS